MAVTKQKELVVEHFITEKVEVLGNEFLLFRTKESNDVWQFRVWNATEQKYIRKSTRQKTIERAKLVGKTYWKEVLAKQEVATVNKKRKRVRKNKGNAILEQHEIFNGKCKVVRVKQSGRVWQFYCYISDEQKSIRKTLKTKDKEEAVEKAESLYLDILAKQKMGITIFERKAKELADAYLKEQQGRADIGDVTQGHIGTLKARIKHYLKFVGENTALTAIKADKFRDYRAFRLKEGRVTLMTLHGEKGTIKALYGFAVERKFIEANYVLQFGNWISVKKSGEKVNRDALLDGQWVVIYKHMQSWHKSYFVKKDKQAEQRRFIYEFALILCNSGIRFGEARKLQWRDIKVYKEEIGDKFKKRCRIHLEGEKTKTGVERVAISRLGATFDRLRKLSKHTKDDDYLFVDNDSGLQIKKDVYYKEWKLMLKETNLDKAHNSIVFYSLRHTYATWQLYKGVDVYSLAKVMGTSVAQIEQHYGHVDIDKIKDRFTKDLRRDENGDIVFGE